MGIVTSSGAFTYLPQNSVTLTGGFTYPTRISPNLIAGSDAGVLTNYPLTNEGVNDSSKVNRNFQDLETLLAAHHTRHENGGTDEISVTGLSGLLADAQTPLAHTQAPATITFADTARLLGRGTALGGAGEEMALSSPCGLTFAWAANSLAIGLTTDTVRLARVGLGVAAHATALLYAYDSASGKSAYADSQVIIERSGGAIVSLLAQTGQTSRVYFGGSANASLVYDDSRPAISLALGAQEVITAYASGGNYYAQLPTLTGPSLLAIDANEYITTDTTALSPQFAGQILRAGVGADLVTYWQADNATNNDSMWRWMVADATGTLTLANNTAGTYAAHDWISVTADGATTINTLGITNTATFTALAGSGDRLATVSNTGVLGGLGGTSTAPNFNTVGLVDTNASHYLRLAAGSDLTADRVLTITTGDAARTVTLSGNPTLSDWFDQSVKVAATPQFAGISVGSVLTVGMQLETKGAPHTNGDARYNARLYDSTAMAAGVGAGVALTALVNGSDYYDSCGIQAYKVNATSGNYAFGMKLWTRPNGGSPTTAITISDTQAATFSSTVQATGFSVGAALISGASISLGNTTTSSTATPLNINLGGTYANATGDPTKAKLKLYDDATNVFGIGVSASSFELYSKANSQFDFYCGTRLIGGFYASGTATSINLIGNEGGPAYLTLTADEGDDNGDTWRVRSDHTTNYLQLQNNISGTVETKAFFSQYGVLGIPDGVTAPGASVAGFALVYVDTADGDLKIRFADGTVKTIVTDT